MLSLFVSSQEAIGQEKNDYNTLLKKYPDEREVILNSESCYQIRYKQNKLEIYKDSYKEHMIMNKNGMRNNEESFYTSELSPVRDYSAYTVRKNGSKVKPDQIITSNSVNDGIFYDDVRETEITYKGLEPGARKVLITKTEFLDPALLHKFVFGGQYPAEKMSFTVEVDQEINIGYKIFNAESSDIKLKRGKKGKKNIYTWTLSNVDGYEYEPRQPSYLSIVPHVVIYIESYKLDKKEIELFGDVSKLFKHYGKYVDKLNKNIDPSLISITDQLTIEANSEEEKVKNIFYWVKDHIKYIAYENGYEGFIPREANLVCERKFGDCKDMASIITAMCTYAGIENVKLAWIGSRKLPYTYAELPTPQVDNHMIAAYVKENEVIFLDATDSYSEYGLCSSFIQGKEALIRMDKSNYIVKEVPVVSPTKNHIQLNVNARIADFKLVGNASISYSGLARTDVVQNLAHLKDDDEFDYIKSDIAYLCNNKFKLEQYNITNLDERDSLLRIDYKFQVDNYLVSLGDEAFLDMFLKKLTNIKSVEADRKYSIERELTTKTSAQINLDLEGKYEIEELPEALYLENDQFIFSAQYTKNDKAVILNYDLELRDIYLKKEDFNNWNKSIKDIKEFMKNTIVLNQIK